MTRTTISIIGKVIIIGALMPTFSSAIAEKLYQWTDKDGTITYTTTPPPPEITHKYSAINTQKGSSPITSAEPKARTSLPSAKETVVTRSKAPITKQESALERRARLSPPPAKARDPQIRESPLQQPNQDKVRKQRKCQDLNNRVSALEARLRTVNSATELNASMLLLTKYQNSFDRHCNN